jgi:hypothetical protein
LCSSCLHAEYTSPVGDSFYFVYEYLSDYAEIGQRHALEARIPLEEKGDAAAFGVGSCGAWTG